MKRRRHKTSAGSQAAPGRPGTAAAVPGKAVGKRLWGFRLAAAFLIPLLILCLVEAVLHLAGYGYPTGFLLPSSVEGKRVFVDNQNFGRRFFAPAMARSSRPVVLTAQKPRDTFRIFVFGESAAFGDPQPDFGLPRMLEVLLRERYPGVRFEVVNAAMTAINSHVILPIARDCAERDGDLWVIYMGNNEVVGPFGSGTVFGPQAPGLALIRSSIALKSTRTGQLITDVARRLRDRGAPPPDWGGMTMFVENQLRQDDPRMSVTYAQFERNLRDILQVGLRHGVKMVVSTVASNLKDCPPFASLHRPDLTNGQAADWQRLYRAGCESEQSGNPVQALELLEKAAQIDARYADLQFVWGRSRLRLKQLDEARTHFALARDYDALRFRADTQINGSIRRIASGRQKDGILFCDGERVIADHSPDGLPGDELLYEHVHLNFEGNYALALSIANEIAKVLEEDPARKANARATWPSAADCARALLWTDWSRYEATAAVMLRLNDPPFTSQLGHSDQVQRLRGAMERLLPALTPEALSRVAVEYRGALQSVTNDWVLYKNFSRLQQKMGDLAGAAESWGQVTRLLPHDVEARTARGLLLIRAGRSDEAILELQTVLRQKPDSVAALNAYGLALSAEKRLPEARRQYQKALRLDPASPETQLNLATLLRGLGESDQAREHLRRTLDRKPNNPEALVELGKMCLSQGWVPEGITNFTKALALEPTDATAHFCLGGAFAMLRRWPEAQSHYAEAVRLRPGYAEARLGLGIELGREGKHGEALEQFAEAVRLSPRLVEARLNLGIALTKVRRVDEAISQFEQVLQINPENALAAKYLQQFRAEPKP